jgi:hypothetical protein
MQQSPSKDSSTVFGVVDYLKSWFFASHASSNLHNLNYDRIRIMVSCISMKIDGNVLFKLSPILNLKGHSC